MAWPFDGPPRGGSTQNPVFDRWGGWRMALPSLTGQHRVPVDDAPLLGLGSRGQLERLMTQYKVPIN